VGKPAKPLPGGEEIRTAAGERRRVTLAGGSVLYVNEKTSVKRNGKSRLTLASGEIFVDVPAGQSEKAFVIETPRRELTTSASRAAVRADERGTGVVVASGQVEVKGLETPLRAGQQLAPKRTRPRRRRGPRICWRGRAI
jgi:ferric-dicitrate binding protein FerR (iron transport regulator)